MNEVEDRQQALVLAMVQARRDHALLCAADWADALGNSADAYEAQEAVAAALGWFGAEPPGFWKSGGGSRDADLTHAPLPPAGVRPGPADFRDMLLQRPAIEAEIALRLGVDVTVGQATALQPDQVDPLIEAMTVSIEVVDSRWREAGQAAALLRLADLQSHGALALGQWLPYVRRDWSAQGCEARIGATPWIQRRGTHALGDPAWLLPQWLRHVTRKGATVLAGTVVTTGTWIGLQPARIGDLVQVEFEGIGAASLQL